MRQEEIDCGESLYYDFNKWLAEKYNVRESILWDVYLPNACDMLNDAFDLFFEELEVFSKENNIEIIEVE